MIEGTPAAPTLEGFDPFSAEYIADPQAFLQRAHRECPVFYHEPLELWMVTRYEDVTAIMRDWQTFSSRSYRVLPIPPDLQDRVPEAHRRTAAAILDANFINTDPPQHTRERKKAQSLFTRPRIASSEDRIREIADEIIDGFVDQGSCDLMQDFCFRSVCG